MRSIGLRISRAILATTIVSIAAMVAAVLVVNEDLENIVLQTELLEQRDIFKALGSATEALTWDTPELSVVQIPAGAKKPAVMPTVFANLPKNYSAELQHEGKTLLVHIESGPSGEFYIAKDISHFEARESWLQMALAVIALLIIGLSLVLATLNSRRIVTPLQRLSDRINDIPVGPSMPRLLLDYKDGELHTIAITFNRFLDELESHVKREQSLLNMASHELRTPIAVISGALDVLESREQLAENDQATLARIRRACTEMGVNVATLLTLARREAGPTKTQAVVLQETIDLVLTDLGINNHAPSRVIITSQAPAIVQADPAMARMVLRNLIQNALQHTTQTILLNVQPDLITITDHGTGLSQGQLSRLTGPAGANQDPTSLTGLGLYIVTLMCERLGWRLEVVNSHATGTVVQIHTSASNT